MKAKHAKQVEAVKVTLQCGPETVAVVEALAEVIGRKFQGMPFTRTGVIQAAIGKGLELLVVEHGVNVKVPGSVLE